MKGFEYLKEELAKFDADGWRRDFTLIETEQSARVRINGREVIQLSSHNYLGLTAHPRLRAAAVEAVEEYGAGTGSTRTAAGSFTIHQELENKLARFKQTEAALLYPSGYAAKVGVLSALLGEKDVVISDEGNHASVMDGIRLTKAAHRIYKHKDLEDLERALKESRDFRVRLIATDGVFSMDGEIAPLPEIVALAEKYDALVMVDDAHASGVVGRNGRGTVDHFGLHGRVHIQVGTLSKAIGVFGGYVAGAAEVCRYLSRCSRPFLFSTSLPPAVAAACSAALDVLLEEPELIERLWENTRFFQQGLKELGFDTGAGETPITPVMAGDGALAMKFADELLKEGVLVQGTACPKVPEGKAKVRAIVTAAHSTEDLAQALEAFEKAGKRLGII